MKQRHIKVLSMADQREGELRYGVGNSRVGSTAMRNGTFGGYHRLGGGSVGNRAHGLRRDLGAPARAGLNRHAPGQP